MGGAQPYFQPILECVVEDGWSPLLYSARGHTQHPVMPINLQFQNPSPVQDNFPLHWPLINSDHMRERLARRELEKKRLEDASQAALEGPNHRSERELRDVRAFKAAAQAALAGPDPRGTPVQGLTRFYMWAQTERAVLIAARVPTGGDGPGGRLQRRGRGSGARACLRP